MAAAFLYLSLRHSTELKTVPWVPKPLGNALDDIISTRNLWGFALIGAYCAFFLDARLGKPRSRGDGILLTILLLLPIGKELSQLFIEGRHCGTSAMAQGVAGIILGLLAGSAPGLLRKGAEKKSEKSKAIS